MAIENIVKSAAEGVLKLPTYTIPLAIGTIGGLLEMSGHGNGIEFVCKSFAGMTVGAMPWLAYKQAQKCKL